MLVVDVITIEISMMSNENQIMTISGFMGFSIGVVIMMIVGSHKEYQLIEKYDLILENVVEEVYKYEEMYEY